MRSHELQDLHRHLTAAAAIVERLLKQSPDAAPLGVRNTVHFRDTGHLSDIGIEAIYKFFDEGCSIEEAAKRMGISIRGSAARRQAWVNKRIKQI